MDKWNSIEFIVEDDEIVTTENANLDGETNKFNVCLVGSLWSNSSFNYGVFRNTIVHVWKLR